MSKIADAIIHNCRADWQKVAKVVWRAHLELKLPDDDAGYDMVAKALAELVYARELEAQGDVTNWRHSEVRLLTGK